MKWAVRVSSDTCAPWMVSRRTILRSQTGSWKSRPFQKISVFLSLAHNVPILIVDTITA